MYVPRETLGATHEHLANFALAIGQLMDRQMTGALGVTTVMAKAARPGKIFVDWSQYAHHKTTIAPYSLRVRDAPTVSNCASKPPTCCIGSTK
jgi:bifunctional non-homologous end joining protein LigD